MFKLHLQAVDSKLATPDELEAAGITSDQIPLDWQLAAHQAHTVKALRFSDADIIINNAMTGDGKTLAGRLQLFSDRQWRSFAMYPTNALAHDQERDFDELIVQEQWMPPAWGSSLRKRLINAQELDNIDIEDASRSEKLKMLLRNDYTLTNPDIFHLIMNFTYQQPGAANNLLPEYLQERYRLFIFDEFHLFGVEQIASVMIAVLLLMEMKGEKNPPRFLFLSATPQSLLTDMAQRVGLQITHISGQYLHGESQVPTGYRRILQSAEIYLYSDRLLDWVEAHIDNVILPFFAEQPAAKGLIIANGVANAHRIHKFLEPIGAAHGITVKRNTGLDPKPELVGNFDLLVATSTVDVGVDFKINLLIFESRDAASHTQRLGRLGRHTHNSKGEKFDRFEAHAILPQWVIEGLQDRFGDDGIVSREAYKSVVDEHFSPLQQFAPYLYKWAGIQAGNVLSQLGEKTIRTQYPTVAKILMRHYYKLFGESVRKYISLTKDSKTATVATASSFRGGNVFTVLQYEYDSENKNKQVVSYNLMTLLRDANLQSVDFQTIYQRAERLGQNKAALERNKPLAAYCRHGWLDKRREISIYLDVAVELGQLEMVIEQNRFRIITQDVPELSQLNDVLYKRVLVALLIPNEDPDLLRRKCRLGYQIELFDFETLNNITGTVAFGRDALLLDSVYFRKGSSDSDETIIY